MIPNKILLQKAEQRLENIRADKKYHEMKLVNYATEECKLVSEIGSLREQIERGQQ
jgi:predicted  nucleic acid-binding Zn-ribbon protein